MSQKGIGAGTGLCQHNSRMIEHGIFSKLPDGVLRPGGLGLTKRLVEYCAFAPGARVIDIGCGTGITVEYLRDIHDLDAIGVDVADELLEQGRERSQGLMLIHADGEELPFGDHSVDGVLAECSLSVMQNVGKVVAEVGRILIPGGKLAITDLYDRNEEGKCSTVGGSTVFGVRHGELHQMLVKAGFDTFFWEDQSALLKEFAARFIMEHGSLEELWQCAVRRQTGKQPFSLAGEVFKAGYFLLVAEKKG